MLGIIGGSGLTSLPDLATTGRRAIVTPHGDPSSALTCGRLAGRDVVFLARHGDRHTIPPHRINYRANLWALHAAGVREIVAVFSVGGIAPALGPGAIVVPDQLIDYTWGRISTLSEESGSPVLHVDFGDPYTLALRGQVLDAARRTGVVVVDGGCYGATQGPRLETKAEIARMRRDGCDLVGMTGMPEAGLARELGLDYACLGIVANWAAGAGPDPDETITLDDVLANVAAATADVGRLLGALLAG